MTVRNQETGRFDEVGEALLLYQPADGKDRRLVCARGRLRGRRVLFEQMKVDAVIDPVDAICVRTAGEGGEEARVVLGTGHDESGSAQLPRQQIGGRRVDVLGMSRHTVWDAGQAMDEVGDRSRAMREVGVQVGNMRVLELACQPPGTDEVLDGCWVVPVEQQV